MNLRHVGALALVGAAALAVVGCAAAGSTPAPAATATPATAAPTAALTPAPTPTLAPTPAPPRLLGPLPSGALDASTAAALQRTVDTMVKEGLPDMVAAVITPEGTWEGAAGVAGPDGRRPTPDDVAAISSVGKMFGAALVMRLVEEGRMDLDAPIADYLDGIDVDANGATVRQALAMQTGIGNTIDGFLGRVYADCDHAWTRDEILGSIPAPTASPGAFEYSNPTYKLVGWAAEQASGLPFAEAVQRYVLGPAGAERIVVQDAGTTTPGPWALPIAGHNGEIPVERFGRDGVLPCVADATFTLAAGSSIAADMPTLARWGWELFGGRIVSPSSLAQMLPPANVDGYGLGIDDWLDFGVPTYGHSGGKPGYKAILAYQPSRQAIVALVVNEGSFDEIGAARRLFEALDAGG